MDKTTELLKYLKEKLPVIDDKMLIDITWATFKEAGVEEGIKLLKSYYPESKPGDYKAMGEMYDDKVKTKTTPLLQIATQFGYLDIEETQYEQLDISLNITVDDVIDSLPDIIKDAVNEVISVDGCPKEMALVTALAFTNVCAQQMYDVDPIQFSKRPLSEFFILLQKASGGKSSVMSRFNQGFERWLKEEHLNWSVESSNYELDVKMYERLMKKWKTGEAIPVKPEKPCYFNPICEDPTMNGVIELFQERPTISILTPEGSLFINSHDNRDRHTKAKLAAGLSKLWSVEALSKHTGLHRYYMPNRRGNMFLMLQGELCGKLLNDKTYKQQGLDSRFLYVDTKPWKKPKWHNNDISMPHLKTFNDKIYNLLSSSIKTEPSNNLWCDLDVLAWSDSARVLLPDWYDYTLTLENDSKYYEHKSWIGKMYEHSVRLAGTLAAFENNILIAGEISDKHLISGMALTMFFLNERLKFVPPLSDSSDNVIAAEEIKEWIVLNRKKGDIVTRSLVIRNARNSCQTYINLADRDRQEVFKLLVNDEILDLKSGSYARGKYEIC